MKFYMSDQEQFAQFRFKEHAKRLNNNEALYMPLHLHRSAEILYVKQGRITVRTVGNEEEVITDGKAALLFPFQPHEYQREDGCEYFRFNFAASIAKSFFKQNDTRVGKRSVFTVDGESLEPFLCRIHEEKKLSLLKVKSFLYSILADFSSQVELCERGTNDSVISKAIIYMSDHKSEQLTLDGVAAAIGYSRTHLSRSINSSAGINFATLLSLLRIDEARILLSETDKTILDIAILTGFGSERNFYRQFHKVTGQSPKDYRKNAKFTASADIIIV